MYLSQLSVTNITCQCTYKMFTRLWFSILHIRLVNSDVSKSQDMSH